MTNSEIFQGLTAAGLLISALVNIALYGVHRAQARRLSGVTSQNALYNAFTYVAEHRSSLEHVFDLSDKPYDQWDKQDKEAANAVCVLFFHLGEMIEEGMIPQRFCVMYGHTIPKCFEICTPYIKEIRQKRRPSFWRSFDHLVARTRKLNTTDTQS